MFLHTLDEQCDLCEVNLCVLGSLLVSTYSLPSDFGKVLWALLQLCLSSAIQSNLLLHADLTAQTHSHFLTQRTICLRLGEMHFHGLPACIHAKH